MGIFDRENRDAINARRNQIQIEETGELISLPNIRNLDSVTSYLLNQDDQVIGADGKPLGRTDSGRLQGRAARSQFSTYTQDSVRKSLDPNNIQNEQLMDEEFRNLRPSSDLQDIPTSSSNAARPRTVAAGYYPYVGSRKFEAESEERKGKLTVMFRDGTLYNYYDVPYYQWVTFRNRLSKGPMLNRGSDKTGKPDGVLLQYPHGPADISDVPADMQKLIWRVAREAQLRYASRNQASARFKKEQNPPKHPVTGRPQDALGPVRPGQAFAPKGAARKTGYGKIGKGRGTNPAANRGKNPGPKK